MKTRVLIADDHPIVRSGIRTELARHSDFEIVGEAITADEVMEQVDECIEIPQFGTKHSINIAVSAGIVLWEVFKKMKGFSLFGLKKN